MILTSCAISKFFKEGLYRDVDEELTIVRLQSDPQNYLGKDVVFSVRFLKMGELPCPLGEDYVNFSIADRVSYITLKKAWMRKDKADVLEKFKQNDTVIIKARIFLVDKEKDPNLEVLEMVPE